MKFKFNFLAIGIALVFFVITFCALKIIYGNYGPHTGQAGLIALMNILNFIVFIVPGCIVAYIARRVEVLHGVIVGIGEGLILIIYYSMIYPHHEFPSAAWFNWLLFSAIASAMGALGWYCVSRLAAKIKNNLARHAE